ncbi:zinc finger BED domain-containing protein RICESLEEPER 2-like [Papaver somniferum]|uniref:zinc finger BED domain-containing protein RICESLEEPER 2-like n=1 Tax=Papaver somniferum TaxID=3469 RepID=UPI000E7002AE|nr:zinc finger BED domain-containing protein RICESLEEPER 2-like [Papaver somniferum]
MSQGSQPPSTVPGDTTIVTSVTSVPHSLDENTSPNGNEEQENQSPKELLTTWLMGKDVLCLNGSLLHMRCCAHILDLIVQDGLAVIKEFLKKIRDSVKYVKGTPSRKQKFEHALSQTRLTGKRLVKDVSSRWNSTYLMLESALEIRPAFACLKELDTYYKHLPAPEEWKEGQVICDRLKVFYDTTLQFSKVKYPSVNFYFKGVLDVGSNIIECLSSEHNYIRNMATEMKLKFDKYWNTCSTMMCIGVVLDPRYKFEFVEFGLEEIYGEFYFRHHVELVHSHLNEVFSFYEGGLSSMDTSTNNLYINVDSLNSIGSTSTRTKSNSKMEEKFRERRRQRLDDNDFDILTWWKTNSPTYPILARMARDILAVPVSTVASESAFSSGGRVVTEYRSSLASDTVEALTCIKDWLPELNDVDLVDEPEIVDLNGSSQQVN